jgi:DNA polymerase sigma
MPLSCALDCAPSSSRASSRAPLFRLLVGEVLTALLDSDMDRGAGGQPRILPTLSPEAALIYYHKLYMDQPLQFMQFYFASAPFRDAVHASGLCIVNPPDASGPSLARLPAPQRSATLQAPQTPSRYEGAPPFGTALGQVGHEPPPGAYADRVHKTEESYAKIQQHKQHAQSVQQQEGSLSSDFAFNPGPSVNAETRFQRGSSAVGAPDAGLAAATHSQSAHHGAQLSPSVQQFFDLVSAVERHGVGPARYGVVGEGPAALNHPQHSCNPEETKRHAFQEPQVTRPVQDRSDLHVQYRQLPSIQMNDPKPLPRPGRPMGFLESPPIASLADQVDALHLEQERRELKASPLAQDGFPLSAKGRPRGRFQRAVEASQRVPSQQQNIPVVSKPTRVSRRTLESLPTVPSSVELSFGQVHQLDRQIWELYDQIRPEDGESQRRARLLAHMNKVVRSEWPNACIKMFGSGASGLNMRSGDVDMCLMVPPQLGRQRAADLDHGIRHSRERKQNREQTGPLTDKQIMRRMAGMLRRSKMTNVQELLRARVPIIKVSDPVSGFQIDLCLNNELVHHNTELLRTYGGLDPRVRPLALIVKYWAKRRGINETYRGTLSSYAYVIMLISFLQIQSPPVLPCLQRMQNGRVAADGEKLPVQHVESSNSTTCNVYFDRSVTIFDGDNKESIAELLIGFFRYFAFEFDYSRSVVSTRLGTVISRVSKKWDQATVAEMTAKAEADADAEARLEEQRTTSTRKLPSHGIPRVMNTAGGFDEDFPNLTEGLVPEPRRTALTPSVSVGPWSPILTRDSASVKASERDVARKPMVHILTAHANTQIEDSVSPLKMESDFEVETEERRDRNLKRKLRMVEQHHFCIEDPFEISHDLGRSVDAETLEVVRHEFVRAHDILLSTGSLERTLAKWEGS